MIKFGIALPIYYFKPTFAITVEEISMRLI